MVKGCVGRREVLGKDLYAGMWKCEYFKSAAGVRWSFILILLVRE
jgi:hypothetical protein